MRVDLSVKVGNELPDWFRGVLVRREGQYVSLSLTGVEKHVWVTGQESPPKHDAAFGGENWSSHPDLSFYNLTFEGVNSFGGCQYTSVDQKTTLVVFWAAK